MDSATGSTPQTGCYRPWRWIGSFERHQIGLELQKGALDGFGFSLSGSYQLFGYAPCVESSSPKSFEHRGDFTFERIRIAHSRSSVGDITSRRRSSLVNQLKSDPMQTIGDPRVLDPGVDIAVMISITI